MGSGSVGRGQILEDWIIRVFDCWNLGFVYLDDWNFGNRFLNRCFASHFECPPAGRVGSREIFFRIKMSDGWNLLFGYSVTLLRSIFFLFFL